jgi:hypothetical protein
LAKLAKNVERTDDQELDEMMMAWRKSGAAGDPVATDAIATFIVIHKLAVKLPGNHAAEVGNANLKAFRTFAKSKSAERAG